MTPGRGPGNGEAAGQAHDGFRPGGLGGAGPDYP